MKLLNVQSAWFGYGALYSMVIMLVREYLKEFSYFGITIIDYDNLNLKEVLDVK